MSYNLTEKIENFPKLSDQECAVILRDHLLEALESDSYIDWDIVTKFILTSFVEREELCKLLNSAIRSNAQKIGNFTIGEWIRKYQDQYLGKERNPDTFFEYISSNPEVKKLSKKEQLFLARILRIYDYLLVIPIMDLEGPVSNIMRFAMRSETTQKEMSIQNQSIHSEQPIPQKIIVEKISLSSALKKFPELGEQLITSMRIKLKNFPEPVRPSINNWLSDYTFNLGFESHSAMDRGTYLFRNENAKVLNSVDREKISYILKAYDENSLVDVNANTKQIIFPRHETRSSEQGAVNNEQRTIINDQQVRVNTPQFQAPRGNISEVYNAIKQSNQPKDIFREERMATENRNAGNINFSSPQKLPYEKQVPQSVQQPQKPLLTPNPQPMRISSQNLRDSSEETQRTRINPNVPPGNIVNLKDKQ